MTFINETWMPIATAQFALRLKSSCA